ncbi:MAG TPA: hypothetical protein VMF69_09310, partial [Gemmataceae bacterium]|nr:hypothetical protein [Gemmataceae bacterium]
GECLFFEINEDFNLHLKLGAQLLRSVVREKVHRWLLQDWPSGMRGKAWQYKQAPVFVLYEWDFGFLDNVREIQAVADRLDRILDLARQALDIQS